MHIPTTISHAPSCLVEVSKDVVKSLGRKAWVCRKLIESLFSCLPCRHQTKWRLEKVFTVHQIFILNIGKPHYEKGALGSKSSLENTSHHKQDATTLN